MSCDRLVETRDGMTRWINSADCRAPSGAIAAWRDLRTNTTSFAYPEICGYFLTLCSNSRDADRGTARATADWLGERLRARDYAARPNGLGCVFTFDLAMMVTGLLNAGTSWRLSQLTSTGLEVLEAVAEGLESLAALHPMAAECASGLPVKWSTFGTVHLLKCVQCLLLARAVGHESMATKKALLLLEERLHEAGDETCPGSGRIALHPLIYGVEGRWIFSRATGNREVLRRARRTIEAVWRHQLPAGGFPEWVATLEPGSAHGCEQSDVLAQVLRMTLLLDLAPAGLASAFNRLLSSAAWQDGRAGILYRPASAERHQNSWATMFAIQAIDVVRGRRPSWWRLV